MVDNALLRMSAQGARPRIAEAYARGSEQGNALLRFQQEQETRNALAQAAPFLATGDTTGARNALAQAGEFGPAYKLYAGEQDRAFQQQKLDHPMSALGKLEADFQSGRISPEAYRAKINSIGKGGTTVNVNTGNIPLGKKGRNDVTKRLLTGREERVGLDNIRKNYDPTFLTYQGQLEGAATRLGEKAGLGNLIPKKNVAQLKKQTQFKQAVQQSFNRYRKDITGAAAAIQELEQLKKALFNLDQSPTEFEAALDAYESAALRLDELRVQFLQRGIDPTTPEGGKAFDDAFFGSVQPEAAPQPNLPAIGAEEDGYRFRGGNPADPNSWEQIQ